MPRVESDRAAVGRAACAGTDAVLAVGAIDAVCEQIVAGADDDGDVLVMCGTTLIVWVTIPEARQVPGLWTIPHTDARQEPDRRGRATPAGCSSGWVDRRCGPGDAEAVGPATGAGVVALHSG